MIAGFTGTKEGISQKQRESLESLIIRCKTLHHGDCIGADESAHQIAYLKDLKIVIHPPTDPKHRAFCIGAAIMWEEKPYLMRNHDIVDCSQILIACPKEERGEELRSGTWATVRYARKCGKKIFIVRPSGRIEIEN